MIDFYPYFRSTAEAVCKVCIIVHHLTNFYSTMPLLCSIRTKMATSLNVKCEKLFRESTESASHWCRASRWLQFIDYIRRYSYIDLGREFYCCQTRCGPFVGRFDWDHICMPSHLQSYEHTIVPRTACNDNPWIFLHIWTFRPNPF